MELEIWGIILAVILFVVGIKIAKWIFWGISIFIILIAAGIWAF